MKKSFRNTDNGKTRIVETHSVPSNRQDKTIPADAGEWTKKLHLLKENAAWSTEVSHFPSDLMNPAKNILNVDPAMDEMSKSGLEAARKQRTERPSQHQQQGSVKDQDQEEEEEDTSSVEAVNNNHNSTTGRRRRRRRLQGSIEQPVARRPVMYTFFTDIGSVKETGMTSVADNDLLLAWKQEWTRLGWEPRVIGLDVAQQHPHYPRLNEMLQQVNYNQYERYCFLRWIAMSAVGGGWMSDYDTFPLYPFDPALPNGGKLTVHEHSKNGGVPDLISGTSKEWLRMASVIIENARLKKEPTWSDMLALHDVFVALNGTVYTMEPHVVPGHVVMKSRGIDEKTCRRTRNKYAIHFSHYAMEFGTALRFGSKQEKVGPQQRAEIALDWLRQWRQTCTEEGSVS